MSTIKQLMTEEKSGGPAPTDKGMKRLFSEIKAELKHQVKAGSHELAAALLRGHDGFVMYGREGKEDEGHGLAQEAQKEQDGLSR